MALSEQIAASQTAVHVGPQVARFSCAKANSHALLAALAWGVGNVSQKTILDHLDPFSANGITCLIGALVLIPFARRESLRTNSVLVCGRRLLGLIALTFSVAATLMQIGYGHTTVTNAGFLVNTAAVFTPIIGWLWFRQRPAFWIWPSSLFTIFGIFLMGGGGAQALSFGDVLSLLSALTFSVWTLLISAFVVRYGRPVLVTLVQLAVCGVICITMGAVQFGLPTHMQLLNALPEILLIGFVSKGTAYVLMAIAQQHISPNSAAILVSAESVFGAALAMIILHEVPGPVRLFGGFFIIIGVSLAMKIPAKGVQTVQKS